MRSSFAALAACSCVCVAAGEGALAQQQLPEVTVTAPSKAKAPKAEQKAAPAAPLTTRPETSNDAAQFGTAGVLGEAAAASEGVVLRDWLQAEPIYRTGELLEAVPGLVVTQHSGEGKANQYFLRGFNLDHGTDIAITVDGMPVNMRTHGHGQGYADTNFIIPEIVRGLMYRKGPYYASEGDFSSAGAIHLDVVDRLDKNFVQLEVGSFGHRRAVAGVSVPAGPDASVLAATELVQFDGPWERPDELRKGNGVLRYAKGTYDNGFAVTGMAYSGSWYATDQIPLSAVENGTIGRYGTLDPTDGGEARRFSLSARWSEKGAASQTRASAYLVNSTLQLFNNFTYFLDNPVDGDQFKQTDDRWIGGAALSKTFFGRTFGVRSDTTLGIQTRYDDLKVGLFKTEKREVLSTVREDHVREFSTGVFADNTLHWTPWLRTMAGLRADLYSADVMSNLAPNSGSDLEGIVSPKLGIVFGPWSGTELYLNAGTGFHSNDARGTVATVDPNDPMQPVDSIPFLVRSKGAEAGIRSQPTRALQMTLAAFILDFDSEIVFVGDAGNTEASRPSRRIGAELTLRARLDRWTTLDLDAAYTRARFTADDPVTPAGRFIPGATEGVVAAGMTFADPAGDGWFGGVKVRWFGPRPLIEDNSVRSEASFPVSARLGYKFDNGLSVRLDGFNLFDQKASQIDYYYESRVDPLGPSSEGIHFHPLEARSVRLSVIQQW